MQRVASLVLVVGVGAGFLVEAQVHQTQPRIQPSEPAQWSAELREAAETFGVDPANPTSFVRTLARHPAALNGLAPLAGYIGRGSMVAAYDQALMALRAAWLCKSNAIWAEGVAEARALGLNDAELHRIAEGPDANWGEWDATILRATDELYRDSALSDKTWDTLAKRYDTQQLIDIIFTGAEYIMLSMMANAYGVIPDERFTDRLPSDVARTIEATRPTPARLEHFRLSPIPVDEWTDEVRELLDPEGSGRPTINLYMTLARHPTFYRPRAVQSAYIRTGATLSGRTREILILRIGWLCGAEYEWAQHVRAARRVGLTEEEIRHIAVGADAPGWDPFDAALIRATDELHRDDTISGRTWGELAARYDERELIDVVITVAGYRMVSMALNTLGVQLEPGREGFPDLGGR